MQESTSTKYSISTQEREDLNDFVSESFQTESLHISDSTHSLDAFRGKFQTPIYAAAALASVFFSIKNVALVQQDSLDINLAEISMIEGASERNNYLTTYDTGSASSGVKSYWELQGEYPDLSTSEYLDLLAAKYNTPAEFLDYYITEWNYEHDSYNPNNPWEIGSEAYHGQYAQEPWQTVKRTINGKATGDCEDFAFLARDTMRRNGFLSEVIILDGGPGNGHAAAVTIWKSQGDYGVVIHDNGWVTSQRIGESSFVGYDNLEDAYNLAVEEYLSFYPDKAWGEIYWESGSEYFRSIDPAAGGWMFNVDKTTPAEIENAIDRGWTSVDGQAPWRSETGAEIAQVELPDELPQEVDNYRVETRSLFSSLIEAMSTGYSTFASWIGEHSLSLFKSVFGEEIKEPTLYTVKSGDTLFEIAKLFRTDIVDHYELNLHTPDKELYKYLAHYNGIENPNRIMVGQKINIPSS